MKPTDRPVIKLFVREGDILKCVWQLSHEMGDALPTASPPDLFVEMMKALMEVPPDTHELDTLWLADRPGRFWMDVQGMRLRQKIKTHTDRNGVPHDYFKDIRIAVVDGLS